MTASAGSGRPRQPRVPRKRPKMHISDMSLVRARSRRAAKSITAQDSINVFKASQPAPGVLPAGTKMAMDDAFGGLAGWAGNALAGAMVEGQTFIGYPVLAELAQRPEYRRISEVIARHMTRKWVRVLSVGKDDAGNAFTRKLSEIKKAYKETSTSDTERLNQIRTEWLALLDQAEASSDKSEKIAIIKDAVTRLNVRDTFRKVAEQDGFFGRGHIYADFGTTDDREELKTPIGDGHNEISQAKIAKGSLKRLKTVEAVWCYPTSYDSNNPLKPDWYKPNAWFVMGTEVHASRLLTFIGREVPDLLKPAYSFGGLSLSQMAKPYVDNWLRTRQSVADIISAFSVFILKTNALESLALNGEEVFKRADIFNDMRDNRGLMIVDKETEDFDNVSAPLSGLHELQAQTQEHMAAVSGIPIVELLGIQPAGLNASSEGEIRTFYDWIHSSQETLFRPNLTRVFGFIQLSELGEVDPDITFEFEPLWSLDEKERAEKELTEAQRDVAYVDAGVLSAQEVRQRLADDAESPYQGLDPDDTPAPDISELLGGAGEAGKQPGAEEDDQAAADCDLGADGEWEEGKHPRGEGGQFGSGGQGGGEFDPHAEAAKGAEAMDKVISSKADVMSAMTRPEIGAIDFRWGDKNGGIAHIIAKRGEGAAKKMSDVLAHGKVSVGVTRQGRTRVQIAHGGWVASLSPDFHGEAGHWLVTGFEQEEGK